MRWTLALACVVTVGCSGGKASRGEGPSAPELVITAASFTAPDASVAFDWAAVDGASRYRIYWQTTPGVTTEAPHMIEVSEVTAGATIPACTTTIYAAIASVGSGGEGPLSAERSGRFCPGGCARPLGYPNPGYLVSSSIGDDGTDYPSCFPYATLAAALAGRTAGEVVQAHGEFAAHQVTVPAGVTLVGNPSAPETALLTGTDSALHAIRLQADATLSGVSITAPGSTAVQVNGAAAHIENVHTTGSEVGVQLDAPGATIDGLVATDNTSAAILSAFSVEPWGATISNSRLKNNLFGLYVDSYYVSSAFTITDSTIACNTAQDIHAYAPDTAAPATVATITFTFANLTMDVSPARRDESAAGCPTASVELCVPLTTQMAETPGLVVFNEAAVNPVVASCP